MTDWKTFNKHVDRLFVKPESKIGKQMHAAVGIAGEAGEILDCVKKTWIYGRELNRENILEECGDVLFYLMALSLHVDGLEDDVFNTYELPDPPETIERLVSVVSDIFHDAGYILMHADMSFDSKAGWGPVTLEEIDSACIRIFSSTLAILAYAGYTLEECLNHNIDKLANKRYKNGYSDEAALARADKAGVEVAE